MYQDLTRIKIKSSQEKGYVIPSDDDLDESKVTVDVGGETKIFNVDEVELDIDDDSQPISNIDAMNLAQALVNEHRTKKN